MKNSKTLVTIIIFLGSILFINKSALGQTPA